MPQLLEDIPSPLLTAPPEEGIVEIFPVFPHWDAAPPPEEIGAFLSESTPESYFLKKVPAREENQQDWVVGILILLMLILVFIRKLFPKRIGQLFPAITSNRFVSQLLREESVLSNRASLVMLIVFLLSMSLFLTQVISYFDLTVPIGNGPGLFAALMLLVAAVLILKILFYGLSSVLLKIEVEMEEYLFHKVVFTNSLGLLLIPMSILIAFTGDAFGGQWEKILVWMGMGLIALFFLFRLSKTFYLGTTSTNFSGFYIIVYLCTLEILPLLVFFKYTGLDNW